ncbi:MAG: hypothetical protein SFV52_01160 [Saprospiraceae bacterium]|nr:hypothetical protein [Saprospiraceae bacterium]
MQHQAASIRPFIGARDFTVSRAFYRDLGFTEFPVFPNMSYFNVNDNLGFYLQDAYVPDWVNNTMIFLEVDDVDRYLADLRTLSLPEKYPGVRLSPIKDNDWGREFFLHDPSGVLWHFGQFHDEGR